MRARTTGRLAATLCAGIAAAAVGVMAQQQPPDTAQGRGAGGRGGGRGGGVAPVLFTAADANKDGALTRDELKASFDKWFSDADTARTGSITQEQLGTAMAAAFPQAPAGGGRGGAAQNQTPRPEDVDAMMAALPASAPVKPRQARKVLVLAKAAGFVHSSIPLAAKTIEALGTKTGAWSTTITYDAADINAQNLKQYDAVFLDSTTGAFLDDPNDAAATEARRKALLEFVRNGKGLAGIHAASDSYHGNPAGRGAAGGVPGGAPAAVPAGGRGGFGPGSQLAALIVAQGDKNSDRNLSKAELSALADVWFDKLDPEKAGRVSQADFPQRYASLQPAPAPGAAPGGGRGAGGPQINVGTWPEFNKMIGGWFKFHWSNPQHIVVKIDDPKSPLTAMFNGQEFDIYDETYTFAQESFSRENVHVLTSVNYDKMSDADKAVEPAGSKRTDGDYGLSWIRREGKGRVFYEAHGHNEKIYAMKPMLEHVLAGVQYAIGDLKADDTPSVKPKGTK